MLDSCFEAEDALEETGEPENLKGGLLEDDCDTGRVGAVGGTLNVNPELGVEPNDWIPLPNCSGEL